LLDQNYLYFFLLLDQKEAKLKAERCFCPQAFTLARRSAGPGFLPPRSSTTPPWEGNSFSIVTLCLAKDLFGWGCQAVAFCGGLCNASVKQKRS